jgi:16S rRNA (cytosine1402-N4)-methyltransferase
MVHGNGGRLPFITHTTEDPGRETRHREPQTNHNGLTTIAGTTGKVAQYSIARGLRSSVFGPRSSGYLSPVSSTQFDSPYHAPVLVVEVLEALRGARRILDGTLGGGGHSLALLESGADVTGLDQDPDAIAAARARLATFESQGRFRAIQSNFADIDSIHELDGAAFDGIVLDLGVSSHQFDDESRGFSFREGAPLDMRMDAGPKTEDRGPNTVNAVSTAADLLNSADEHELSAIFKDFGDEPKGGRLAREVVRRRANRPFETSDDLVGAIRAVLGPRSGPGDFARLFQALRIAVNGELDALAKALPLLRDRLAPAGVLAVIAYHSGEDRIVKHAFREWSLSCVCPPRQIVCTCRGRPLGELITRKAVSADAEEVAHNARARSAHLRVWRRSIGHPAARGGGEPARRTG